MAYYPDGDKSFWKHRANSDSPKPDCKGILFLMIWANAIEPIRLNPNLAAALEQ